MEITQAPNGWQDLSEHDGEFLEYRFKISDGQKFALILKVEWDNETEWKLRIGTDDGSFLSRSVETVGKFEILQDAVKIGETWMQSKLESVYKFIG